MRTTLLALFVLMLLLPAVVARAGDVEEEAARVRIEVLVNEARLLKQEGRHDAADVLLKRAHELKARLEPRETPFSMEQAEKALHGLEMGMESLKMLGRQDELNAVARVADALRAKMKQARAAREREREHEKQTPEAEAIRHRIELWRDAAKAFREAERRDLVEQAERVIHAHEILLSGRRDDEAREIVKRVPSAENQAELLGFAAHLWAQWGHETRAANLKKASEELLGRRKDAAQARGGRVEVAREHLEALQGQMKEIREMVTKLREQIETMERRR